MISRAHASRILAHPRFIARVTSRILSAGAEVVQFGQAVSDDGRKSCNSRDR